MSRRRAEEHLAVFFQSLVKVREFAREAALLLTEDDFIDTVEMEGGPFDEYGICLPLEVAKRYGLERDRAWYLKLKVVARREEQVFFLSFHRPERRMWRKGGVLDP